MISLMEGLFMLTRHHKLHATYLEAEVSGVNKWVEIYHIHNALRQLFGMPSVRLSLIRTEGAGAARAKGIYRVDTV